MYSEDTARDEILSKRPRLKRLALLPGIAGGLLIHGKTTLNNKAD
jgi:hypothetical protein